MKTLFLALAIAAAALTIQAPLSAQNGGGQAKAGKAKAKAGPFKRLANGKPDMAGFWQTAVFFSAFDLEEHKEATFEVPAGQGVVVDPPITWPTTRRRTAGSPACRGRCTLPSASRLFRRITPSS